MDYAAESLKLHYKWQGKIEVTLRAPLETADDLSLAYTPGVAEPCLEIQKDVSKSYDLTRRGNLVAVITDGTAVLGLGDIGPEAGMPVMEGKCALFKRFGNVDAIPLCVRSKNVDEIVETVRLIAGSFGGVNLEDISAPRCFEIERRLKECCDIPIFHDDQHGTAVVTLAAMLNALKLIGKDIHDINVVTSGAGAAGLAIIRLLIAMGLDPHHVILCDRHGAIYEGRDNLNPHTLPSASTSSQQILHLIGCIRRTTVRSNDPASGGRGQTELLSELVHDLQISLGDGHLWHLLPVAGRGLDDSAMLGDELLSLLPSGIRLTVTGEGCHIHFGQDADGFHLFGKSAPFFLCFRLQPLWTGRCFLVGLRFAGIQRMLAWIAFQFLHGGRLWFSASGSHWLPLPSVKMGKEKGPPKKSLKYHFP